MAQALSEDDEVIVFDCDLDLCTHYKSTVFAFEKHRRIEHYGLITARTGIVPPPVSGTRASGARYERSSAASAVEVGRNNRLGWSGNG